MVDVLLIPIETYYIFQETLFTSKFVLVSKIVFDIKYENSSALEIYIEVALKLCMSCLMSYLEYEVNVIK
jgi:hypothetical protein